MDKLKPRKEPKQNRSKIMVSNILEAAIRVLKESPFDKFTTNRVAEKAGISVGSLYQYFPNKQSILFELERQAVNRMIEGVDLLLFDDRHLPEERMYKAIDYFFTTESSLYKIPFSANPPSEYKLQVKKIKRSMDFFLRSNNYIDQDSDDFLSDYLITFLAGVAEKVSLKKDVKDLKPWIETTFNTVMQVIDRN
ncbi:MAG: TetR/AcrR family transcriptional regulator [SAR86 cluster bacterium]|nr:TetR/AcrR family transcriptional regulator [SAR86 cluster bacterium]